MSTERPSILFDWATAWLVSQKILLPGVTVLARQIGLVQQWGSGEVASADGLRFIVPIRTIAAGRNPKYFPKARG